MRSASLDRPVGLGDHQTLDFAAFSTRPPVSTTMQGTSVRRANPYWRSRVSPGRSATSASRVPVIALNKVDFPTFGRPISATTGSKRSRLRLGRRRRRRRRRGRCCAKRREIAAVGQHDDRVVGGRGRIRYARFRDLLACDEHAGALVEPMHVTLIVRDDDRGAEDRGCCRGRAASFCRCATLPNRRDRAMRRQCRRIA